MASREAMQDLLGDVSAESIDFQSGKMYEELTIAIGELRSGGRYGDEDVKKVNLPAIVKKHTGMTVEVFVSGEAGGGAHIYVPMVDKNHPFIREVLKDLAHEDGIRAIRKAGGKVKGSVDRLHSRVTGVFTEMVGRIHIGQDLIRDRDFTDGEIASIVLHECGHLFTYFEYLGNAFMTNFVLAHVSRQVYQLDSVKERVTILMEAEQALNIKLDNKEKLVSGDKRARETVVQTVLLSKVAEKSRHELGTNLYDARSWEQMCDQFAVRHGGGRDLATGLERLYRKYGSPSTMPTVTYLCLEVLFLLTYLAYFFISIPLTIILLMIANPMEKMYDEPGQRVAAIRRQIIESLKQPDIDKQYKKQLLNDIEAIKKLEDQLDDRRGVLMWFWTTVTPWGRKALREEEIQKHLEETMANELFVIATKFETGAKHA